MREAESASLMDLGLGLRASTEALMKQRAARPAEGGKPEESSTAPGLSRRLFLAASGTAGALLFAPRVAASASLVRAWSVQTRDSIVIRWNDAFLQGVRDSKLGPPMVARA